MTTPNPYAPPASEVQDIFDPQAPIELADRGTRLAAFIVDYLIMIGMWYLPFLLVFLLGGGFGDTEPSPELVLGSLLAALAGFSVWAWLTVKYVLANGQSIAKKMLGIKVVRTDGSPASFSRIFWLRNVVNGFLGLILIYWFVDALFIFGEPRQCLHDKLADTIVIQA